MAVSDSFIDDIKALFAPFGAIRVRRMFGGAGVYCDDLFFAILDDGVVYLKSDAHARAEFEARGLAPFTFEGKDGAPAVMAYYSAPEEIFDDDDELRAWTSRALDAARRAAGSGKSRSRTPRHG